ncbi:MAG: nif-specific transcriptional activator NifA [Desulfobulbaceae bacterium]|nr:nif-specific transcriptional activator NifA [Desulfobulbaceae bacterium]
MNMTTPTTPKVGIDDESNPGTKGMELAALQRITQLIGNAADLDTTLTRVLEVLRDTLNMQRATLLLIHENSQKLTIRASCGLSNEEELRGVYNLDEGICGQIFQTRLPFVVPDIHSEPLFLNRTGARPKISKMTISFLGVPVLVGGQPVGVLSVDRLFGPEVSFEEDVRFLGMLAVLIAQFLQLHNEIRRKEERLQAENKSLKSKLHGLHDGHFIIGHSKPMQDVFSIIDKISQSKATALLLGESGTGKELVARAIHDAGPRKDQAFVKVNCAALPETLLESELFGHERGSFTGAFAARQGRFELADNGTIFLDEIGEMPVSLQAKMLRVLQEKQFERIGGVRTYTVNVRIIAATNVSLERAVAEGHFRADLYYRLNVVPVVLPPLRERREDIPLLFNHFLLKSNQRNGKDVKLTSELLDFLMEYQWPGNVREMQNMVERMVILAENERLTLNDLPSEVRLPYRPAERKVVAPPWPKHERDEGRDERLSLHDIEKAEVESALKRHGWVQARAAKELGITQRQMGYRIKKYGLSRYTAY